MPNHFHLVLWPRPDDGLGRRIKKAVTHSGDWDCTYHYYHDGQRTVEVRNGRHRLLKSRRAGIRGVMYIPARRFQCGRSAAVGGQPGWLLRPNSSASRSSFG